MSIEIKEVKTKSELKRFINFVNDLYKGNQYWCPPMYFDEMDTLHWDKNPAFEYCEARYWMAYRDGKIVGRIAGILNTKANSIWNEKNIRFGWFDFIDDAEVPEKLLQCVIDWGKEKGMNHIHGPLGFTDMDREGMMVKGFEELGSIASYYNHAYYPTRIEAIGFTKDVDWVQNLFSIPDAVPEKISRFAELVQQKYKLHLLEAKNKKEFLPYARGIFETLNKCFKDLYGFVPLSTRQIDILVKAYFGFVRPEFVGVVLNEANEVVGFGIALPSLTKALQKCNGKLFPFGFIHLLRALKSNDFVDMYVNGVDPEYQNKGVPSVYFNFMCQNFIKYKVKWALSNPQLEDNNKALNLWQHFDARQHITRRCYTKQI